jgi:hypothetical protein
MERASLLGAVSWPVRLVGEGSLRVLDAALASTVLERAVDRTLDSGLARHAIDRALQGPIIDAIARDIVRYRVVDRVVDELLAHGDADQTVERILSDGVVDRTVDQLLSTGVVDRAVDRVLAGLLDSDELWRLVETVAASPAVTEAVTQQTAGFADQVAGGVRARSHNADAWLERYARRALRKPAR